MRLATARVADHSLVDNMLEQKGMAGAKIFVAAAKTKIFVAAAKTTENTFRLKCSKQKCLRNLTHQIFVLFFSRHACYLRRACEHIFESAAA